jgi:protein-arginine kinase activator protein McsA
MDISVKRQDYLEALELNIGRAAEVEEFELCTKARDYIQQLKQEKE